MRSLAIAVLSACALGCSIAHIQTDQISAWSVGTAVVWSQADASGGYATVQVLPTSPWDDVDFVREDLPEGGERTQAMARSGSGVQANLWSGAIGALVGAVAALFAG